MLVAYELGKTVDEVSHLTSDDIADWLAFFILREKKLEEALKRNRRGKQ